MPVGVKEKLKTGIVHTLPIEYVLENFYSGDYTPSNCKNKACTEVHLCGKLTCKQRWELVLSRVREDEQYEIILESLVENGLVFPLGAKYYQNKLLFCDGHHRIAALLDLDITMVAVYIGAEEASIDDMVAIDTQAWYGGSPDSPFNPLEK